MNWILGIAGIMIGFSVIAFCVARVGADYDNCLNEDTSSEACNNEITV